MTISTEIEKLTNLRDKGDLTQEEFEKAKALLLSGEKLPETTSDKEKKLKTQKWVAILLTITVGLSSGSALIKPSPVNMVLVILWVVAATLAWSSYSRLKKEHGGDGKSGLGRQVIAIA